MAEPSTFGFSYLQGPISKYSSYLVVEKSRGAKFILGVTMRHEVAPPIVTKGLKCILR